MRLLFWQQPGHKSHTSVRGLRRDLYGPIHIWKKNCSLLTSMDSSFCQCPSVLTKRRLFGQAGKAYTVARIHFDPDTSGARAVRFQLASESACSPRAQVQLIALARASWCFHAWCDWRFSHVMIVSSMCKLVPGLTSLPA